MGAPRLAVVLVSGGLDSATCLAMARAEGLACHALTFDYGQRHRHELHAAGEVAGALGAATHRVIGLDPAPFAGSALTDGPRVPAARAGPGGPAAGGEIPITYVPARNLVFLSMAAGVCEVLGARELFIGANAVDYSGYPDCRPGFLSAFEGVVNLATRLGVEAAARGERWLTIRAPLVDLPKREIIRRGVALGVDFSRTHSCYDPDARGLACGRCEACALRRGGFAEAGVPDPTRYSGAELGGAGL